MRANAEGRSTGVPTRRKAIQANGSPMPVFETDDDRVSYLVRLPVHPSASMPEASRAGARTAGTTDETPEVTPEVRRVVLALDGDCSRQQLQLALGLRDAEHFRKAYLLPALDAGLVEMTLPDTPRSSKQRYRVSAAGQQWRRWHDGTGDGGE